MIDDSGCVALREFVYRSAGVAGPDDFHRWMRFVRAKLEVDILRRVKDRFAEPVAEGGNKSSRLVRPADGETKMMKFKARTLHRSS